ncbi:MAG: DUF4214 domain-containing protein [Sulfitobacter sp.]
MAQGGENLDVYSNELTLGVTPSPQIWQLFLQSLNTERIGFYFDDGGPLGAPGNDQAWSEPEKDHVRESFEYLETILDVAFFYETIDPLEPAIKFNLSRDVNQAVVGSSGSAPEVTISQATLSNEPNSALLHGIGHALGLSHTHDGHARLPGVSFNGFSDEGQFALNSSYFSRMSQFEGYAAEPELLIFGDSPTLGAIDIAALQALFGANKTQAHDDSIYTLPSSLHTIWDTSGYDVIDFSETTERSFIDLRSASLLVDEIGGGALSYTMDTTGELHFNGVPILQGGYTIAYDVEIEAAVGGYAPDVIIGNELDNRLTGGEGNDTLFGGSGNDILIGGFDSDNFHGGPGNDVFYTETRADREWATSVAHFSGLKSESEISGGRDYAVVSSAVGGRDKLFGFTFLAFDDGIHFLENGSALDFSAGGPDNFITPEFITPERVALLYEAALNRDGAIDLPGLNFYIGVAERDNLSDEFIAADLMNSPEFTASFGDVDTLSNAEFLEQIYLNVLDRPSDAAGLQFYLDLLNDGTITKALALADIAVSLENTAASSAALMGLYENSAGEWSFL